MTVKWCISVLGMFNYTLLCSTGPRASTDRPCPSHSRDTDTLHVPTPRRHATLMWTVQCVVVIATSLRMPTTGKRKAETRAQRTARLERKTSEPLHTCASLSMSPCILGFHLSSIATCSRDLLHNIRITTGEEENYHVGEPLYCN